MCLCFPSALCSNFVIALCAAYLQVLSGMDATPQEGAPRVADDPEAPVRMTAIKVCLPAGLATLLWALSGSQLNEHHVSHSSFRQLRFAA
jgi:hypothetical protein